MIKDTVRTIKNVQRKHYKFQPNEYVLVMKNGKVIKQGVGLSFFCNTLSTGMSVVPTVSFDTFFAFDDVLTSDFQGINIQGDISYIIRDYEKVARMIDFSYTGEAGYEEKKVEAKQVMGKRITNLAKTSASKFVNARDVKAVIQAQEELATFLSEEMTSNEAIKELGLDVVTVSILAVSPSLETKRALESATREQILQQQDNAIYKRRNAAIEQERIVKENELNTEIIVAEKEHENQMLRQKNALEGYTSVCGHRNTVNHKIWKNEKGNLIMCDCGCGFRNGKLGCLCLETKEEFYV